mgnify:FL=1
MSVQEAIKKLTDAISTPKYPIVRDHMNDLVVNDSAVSILYRKPLVKEIQYDNGFGLLYVHLIYAHRGDEPINSGWNGFHIDNIIGEYSYANALANDGNAIGVGNFSGGYPLNFFSIHVNSTEKHSDNTTTFQVGVRSTAIIPDGTWRDINVQVPLTYDGKQIQDDGSYQ